MRLLLLLSILILLASGCERPTQVTPDDGIPPPVPTGIHIQFAEDGEILVQWNDNTEADFTYYNIYRAINKSAFSFVYKSSNSFYYDDSLSYSDTYSYIITAVDRTGKESPQSDTVSAVPANKNKPHKPAMELFLVKGQNSEGHLSIELTWNPNQDSDIDKYLIYRDTTASFNADSANMIGSSTFPSYTDNNNLILYKKYYYKIKAIDKGGLLSSESDEASDMILGIPQMIFPQNGSRLYRFPDFVIKTLPVAARYKIIVQTNRYFGEAWSKEVYSDLINDTLHVPFNSYYIEPNITYYWRVAAFTADNTDPNSISDFYQFVIKPE